MANVKNRERIEELAIEYGFSEVGFVEPEDLVFNPEFRQCCEDNVCGNFNKNYSCPPYCGTVQEMKEKTAPFQYGLVLKTELEVDDAYDDAAVKPIKKDHSVRSAMLIKELIRLGVVNKGLSMFAGPCSICDKCTMPAGEPCRFPEDRTSCLSAYCLNVTELAQAADLCLSWEGNQVTFFSVHLWK